MKNADYIKARGIKFDSLVAQPTKGGKMWSIVGSRELGEGKVCGIGTFVSLTVEENLGRTLKKRTDESGGRAILRWLDQEHKVLDDVETRYLSGVIGPFRDVVVAVWKRRSGDGVEHISIQYRDPGEESIMAFPDFEAGKMYKGMENGRKYSLEELGL